MKGRYAILALFLLFTGLKSYCQCAGPISCTITPAPDSGNTYPPGQVVSFCVTVDGFNQNLSNWFHGLTLNFGPGWNVSSLTVTSYPPSQNTMGVPNIWGYFPNPVTGLATGQSYGAGFYFETGEGNNTGIYDGNPGDNYGDYCPTTCTWVFCFTIEVSPTATPGTSLSLSVTPTGDGQSGSWSGGLGGCNDSPTTICTATVSGPTLVASATGTGITCFGLCNGTARVTALSGFHPYTYKWSTVPAQTATSISNLCAGAYTVTVTDSLMNTATASYTVTEPASLAVVDSIVNPSCHGSCNGAVITAVSGGTQPYNYSWVGGAAPNSPVDYSICAGLAILTVTDSNNCVLKDSFTLTQPAPGAVNVVSKTNVLCRSEHTGAITVDYSGGAGGTISYHWSNSNITASDTGLAAGNYSVTATDSAGCTASAVYAITQPANGITIQNPVITDATCFGVDNGSIAASAIGGSGNLSYTWTEVSDTASLSGKDISNLMADIYVLTVTDANGCSVSASYQVTSPSAIIIDSLTTHNVTCFNADNGSASIYAHGGTPPLLYEWNNNPSKTGTTITGLEPGEVGVVITDAHQCTSSDSAAITQPAALVITLVNQTNVLCFGGDDGTIVISVSGGTPAFSYAWSNNGSTFAGDSTLIAGNYAVTVTDANGCSVSQSYTISQPAAALTGNPVATNVLCFGDTSGAINAAPAGGTSPYSFRWSNGEASQTATGLAEGYYNCTITDSNNCTVSFTDSVSQPPPLAASLTPSPVKCFDQATGSIALNITGGTPPYVYTATQDSVNFISGSNGVITGLDTGTYVVQINDNNTCRIEQAAYIPNAIPDSFSITADSTSCYGGGYADGSITITAITAQNGPYEYSIDGGNQQYNGTFTNLTAGPHTIVAVSQNGCTTDTTVSIYGPPQIVVSIDPDTFSISLGGGKAVIATSENASSPIFSWSPAVGLSCADCPNPIVSPYQNTDYTLTVSEQKDGTVCYGYASLSVIVNSFTPVFVPNAFSPNGDGNDDIFKVYGDNIAEVHMEIFNRWGELVYETTNAQAGWDGTYKGQLQEPNVYVYVATITFLDNSQMQKSGSVTLMR